MMRRKSEDPLKPKSLLFLETLTSIDAPEVTIVFLILLLFLTLLDYKFQAMRTLTTTCESMQYKYR